MPKVVLWKIQYFNLFISKFGERFRMPPDLAYRYIREHGGLDYLDMSYDYEHTQSLDSTIQSVITVCRRNGGTL